MTRILPLALGAALVLTACTGGDGASTSPTATTPSPTTDASTPASTIALDEAFCDDAEQLYQRDLAISEALAGLNTSSMSPSELEDPAVFDAYIEAIDLDGWDSWRALYAQAAADSGSPEMEAWLATIIEVTDLQFAAYAEAAETATTLTEWSQQAAALLDAQADEIEVEGDEALRASEASMATCGVPLSVAAGELLGYEG
ncbi:hypothetical protein [Demequina zhanjiangensis]|uniref:Lipoprotein n=1 Tax=Demequina zhanjiangensis TaxID=3051659 RepID=A0ABT8G421_9MICO|nr:hypothetical protein [Demequina sp. SYSU T00b26]MDN4473767.1 hypothetical protein [Demequina sp. SYSU T00b26]